MSAANARIYVAWTVRGWVQKFALAKAHFSIGVTTNTSERMLPEECRFMSAIEPEAAHAIKHREMVFTVDLFPDALPFAAIIAAIPIIKNLTATRI